MLHIMAGVYVVCFFVSALMSTFYLISLKRHFASSAYQNINTHLSFLNLFWSDAQSEILNLSEGAIERDQKAAIQSFLRVALFACFTSLFGCLFLSLFIFSVGFLAKPRIEKKIFAGPLAQNSKLNLEEIKDLVLKLKAEFGLDGFQLSL